AGAGRVRGRRQLAQCGGDSLRARSCEVPAPRPRDGIDGPGVAILPSPMIASKLLALVFSTMIFGQTLLVRRHVGTWLFPASLFGLFWFLFTFIPLVLLYWIPIDPLAIGYVLLCAITMSLSSFPFQWRDAFRRHLQRRKATAYDSLFIRSVFYISA